MLPKPSALRMSASRSAGREKRERLDLCQRAGSSDPQTLSPPIQLVLPSLFLSLCRREALGNVYMEGAGP